MAGGINDVFLQGIDPQLLQQQAAAKKAQSTLSGMNNSPAMAQALRQANTARPQMQGSGMSSTAVNPFEALAAGMVRDKGDKRLNAMDAQSKALRGEVEQGDMAAMQAGLQQQEYAQNMAREKETRVLENTVAAEGRKNKQQGANNLQQSMLRRQEAVETDLRNSGKLKSGFKTWVDPEGNEKNFARTDDGIVTMQDGVQVAGNNEGFIPLTEYNKQQEIDVTQAGNISAGGKKEARETLSAMGDIKNVNTLAAGLSKEDVAQLSGSDVLVKALGEGMTPDMVANYAKDNFYGYSPAVKKYLTAVTSVGAKMRNQFYGSALTRPEIVFGNAFLPSAADLSFEQQQMRLGASTDSLMNMMQVIDDTESAGGKLRALADNYVYTPKVAVPVKYPNDPEKQARFEAYANKQQGG